MHIVMQSCRAFLLHVSHSKQACLTPSLNRSSHAVLAGLPKPLNTPRTTKAPAVINLCASGAMGTVHACDAGQRVSYMPQVNQWSGCACSASGSGSHCGPGSARQHASHHSAKHSDNLGSGASLPIAMSDQALLNLCNPGLQVRERAGAATPRGRARRDRAPQPAHCVERAAAAVP